MRRTLVITALGLGCGPSFTAVYEGDARFEHCYALEDTQSASLADKAACWRDWTKRSTYGQTRDRVEYATARYHALTAPTLPTDDAMMQAAPGMVDTSQQLAAPTPTSAFAPPPGTTASTASSSSAAPLAAPAPSSIAAPPPITAPAEAAKPPGAACIAGCQPAWDACVDTKPKCDRSYATCAAKCLTAKK